MAGEFKPPDQMVEISAEQVIDWANTPASVIGSKEEIAMDPHVKMDAQRRELARIIMLQRLTIQEQSQYAQTAMALLHVTMRTNSQRKVAVNLPQVQRATEKEELAVTPVTNGWVVERLTRTSGPRIILPGEDA